MQGPLAQLLLWAAARESCWHLPCEQWGSVGLSGARPCRCGWAVPASLGVQSTGKPECSSCLHHLCTRGILHHQAQGVVAAAWDHALDIVWRGEVAALLSQQVHTLLFFAGLMLKS